MICFQGQPFHITVIQVYASTTNAKEAEVKQFCEVFLEITPKKKKKRIPFYHRGLECRSRKSRDTWSNRQVWPWSTNWNRANANRILWRECTGHSKHPLPTTLRMTLPMDITRWAISKSDWLYSLRLKMEKLYTVSKNKTGSWLWLISWTPYCKIQT